MSFSDILFDALHKGAGMGVDQARTVAAAVIQWGADQGHAGDRHYWPCRFRELTSEERDAAIRRDFNGRNLKEVCRRFGVSHMTVYRAVRQSR